MAVLKYKDSNGRWHSLVGGPSYEDVTYNAVTKKIVFPNRFPAHYDSTTKKIVYD